MRVEQQQKAFLHEHDVARVGDLFAASPRSSVDRRHRLVFVASLTSSLAASAGLVHAIDTRVSVAKADRSVFNFLDNTETRPLTRRFFRALRRFKDHFDCRQRHQSRKRHHDLRRDLLSIKSTSYSIGANFERKRSLQLGREFSVNAATHRRRVAQYKLGVDRSTWQATAPRERKRKQSAI